MQYKKKNKKNEFFSNFSWNFSFFRNFCFLEWNFRYGTYHFDPKVWKKPFSFLSPPFFPFSCGIKHFCILGVRPPPEIFFSRRVRPPPRKFFLRTPLLRIDVVNADFWWRHITFWKVESMRDVAAARTLLTFPEHSGHDVTWRHMVTDCLLL